MVNTVIPVSGMMRGENSAQRFNTVVKEWRKAGPGPIERRLMS